MSTTLRGTPVHLSPDHVLNNVAFWNLERAKSVSDPDDAERHADNAMRLFERLACRDEVRGMGLASEEVRAA